MGLRKKNVKSIVFCFKSLCYPESPEQCLNWNIFITKRTTKIEEREENVSFATDRAEDGFRIRFEASALQENQQRTWQPWTEWNITRTKSVSVPEFTWKTQVSVCLFFRTLKKIYIYKHFAETNICVKKKLRKLKFFYLKNNTITAFQNCRTLIRSITVTHFCSVTSTVFRSPLIVNIPESQGSYLDCVNTFQPQGASDVDSSTNRKPQGATHRQKWNQSILKVFTTSFIVLQ